MRQEYIYGLICPRSGQIRYIGKSIRPKDRLNDHMNDRSKCHRVNWLSSLREDGLKPSLAILEIVPRGESWQDRERHWIAHGLLSGWPLTNNTSGGDGVPDLCGDARDRIRSAWVGRKHSPESLIKIGNASRGRRHTDEHKEKVRQIMKKREITWGHKIAESVRKLTNNDVQVIINCLKNGEKVVEIAERYGVHRTTISKVKAGRYIVK